MSQEKGELSKHNDEGICEIIFSHPKSNSLPQMLLYSLADEIAEAGRDQKVKVIVLKSVGDGAFCAGASFDELLTINSLEKAQAFFSGFARVIMAMKRCPKFVIARVQGKVVGGGAGIVAAADYALATQTGSVRLSELAIGIGPFTIGPAVQRKVGVSTFSEMAISTEWRSAQWCKERGLYADVFENIELLDNAVKEFSKRLSSYSTNAMKALKKLIWQGTDDWETVLAERVATTSQLVLSSHAQDAIQKAKDNKK